MRVTHLSLADFRSYASLDVALGGGVTAFVGPNGQGKTNLVEAIGYIATLDSHRVATDQPLVRFGAPRAIVRANVEREGRTQLVEIELNPGGANRARLNRNPVPRPREVLGVLRTVLFAPEDLALVKGDPGERRRFLDELLVARWPRFAGVRADYDRVLKQRNTLLRTAAMARRNKASGPNISTLDAWDHHLALAGAELVAARLALISALSPLVDKCYVEIAEGGQTRIGYRSTISAEPDPTAAALTEQFMTALGEARANELDRGITLVGPHRDEMVLELTSSSGDNMPARGYASHGESWSYALALRLAAYDLLRSDGSDGGEPVLILDDVFAELDAKRRRRLAERVSGADQVLITAAVDADVPEQLIGQKFTVADGQVSAA
ncbi:DNA replication and repair protein RecF [Catenulispora acidiphila DSM 44928]|uniref:DNA replication and repair protein RecF n=1 Tax=Catenulispora acidiphila (strain DSM 44928 / JCM 14897 / NBRC 102108 / NRRL B-24433 / ID139908) TaxID=479433 RepID=C7QFM0_CATAD|nr:DNA replication/repair protein RecF [Catenulispora acidiphila]ACU68959.1 DNA replication and repair protein RecF [Catenulispora acidiphila DSM 44928]